MAVRYRIDCSIGVIFNTYWGVLTDDDLYGHQRQMLADPSFHPDLHQLSNYLDVTETRVTSATIRRLAEARCFRPGVRRAIVVGNDLGYGLSRMYQTLHEDAGEDVKVFRDLSEALCWLGLSSDDADRSPELSGVTSRSHRLVE